jgi:hypothetical protein
MAKEGGMGTTISIDDAGGTPRAISNDITNFTWATPRGVQDVTGVDKSGLERLVLLADLSFNPTGVFNDAANMSHAVLKTIPSSSVLRTVALNISGQTMSAECLGTDYSLTRGQDGSVTWSAPFVLADGTVPTWS